MTKKEKAMSNETDLDWLARNVHEWPEGKHEVLVRRPRNVDELIWSSVLSNAGWITKDQWLARRAELQNKPVTVSNETVQLEQPVAVAGTGNGSASESAFLIGRVIDLLRTSADHFSSNELADLHQLCDAELTKRDERVCGGQKYIDAHWFERGELPPVGFECEMKRIDGRWCKAVTVGKDSGGRMVCELNDNGVFYASTSSAESFRPIRTERDELLAVIVEEMNHYDTDGKLADAILAAGFSIRDK